jgi:hypothetical protein
VLKEADSTKQKGGKAAGKGGKKSCCCVSLAVATININNKTSSYYNSKQ